VLERAKRCLERVRLRFRHALLRRCLRPGRLLGLDLPVRLGCALHRG
jgi:hypothetical protein